PSATRQRYLCTTVSGLSLPDHYGYARYAAFCLTGPLCRSVCLPPSYGYLRRRFQGFVVAWREHLPATRSAPLPVAPALLRLTRRPLPGLWTRPQSQQYPAPPDGNQSAVSR